MRRLVGRRTRRWQRVPVMVLLLVVQVVVGLLVLVLRTARVAVSLAVAATGRLEVQLAARTRVRPLSQTGIAAIAAAFVHEFHAAYRGAPT